MATLERRVQNGLDETRTLVLGLIKMLQRRGILGEDELQRFLTNLLEAGELKDE